MFSGLGTFVTKHWRLVILAWLVLGIGVPMIAPRWDDVTYDGDFAFLPPEMPSAVGTRLTASAFPENRAKSEMVLIVARNDATLRSSDLDVADDLARRFHNYLGAYEAVRSRRLKQEAADLPEGDPIRAERLASAEAALQNGLASLTEAIRINDQFADALHNRSLVYSDLGEHEEAQRDRETAVKIDPALRDAGNHVSPSNAADLPLVDVWSRHNEVVGTKLRSDDKKAQLVLLKLSTEFAAAENIRVIETVEQELAEVREQISATGTTGLMVGMSGSAAVGGEMLRSAAESIRNTEMYTITLVIAILLVVYRAPLLVTVPLITIAVSLIVATGLLAMLTQVGNLPGFEWWGFKIFKTTKIFIVVILFGAGTDFCLFLIARYREELQRGVEHTLAVAAALTSVSSALAASALTTIFGLGMMFFADFGKFRSSGPAIGICLVVALLACLTLAPALLRAMGGAVFWPRRADAKQIGNGPGITAPLWEAISKSIVAYPGRILVLSVLLFMPMAVVGAFTADHVTFDFLSELDPGRPCIHGTELLKRHFPIGEGGPVIVLAYKADAGFDDDDSDKAATALTGILELTKKLRDIDGVHTVRSLYEPLGDPPQRLSLISRAGRRKVFLREHQLTKSIYLAQLPGYKGNVTRFELVLNQSPFSREAVETFSRIDEHLRDLSKDERSFWLGAKFAFTGTTAGIRDLRAVTYSDNWRIRALVVLAVYAVLLAILRRPGICLYLILSVLFSYLVTMGATEIFFGWAYGDSFQGLDWKVPIFLFVILVAVGEDYNIYLATRVLEEQERHGPFAGLRRAIVHTGGIITSCGIIMAGTFLSMTSGTLRGIVELGFALSLGILLDTFIVRPILVPAFLALECRRQLGRKPKTVRATRRQLADVLEVSGSAQSAQQPE